MAVVGGNKSARKAEAPWLRTTQQVVQDLQTNTFTGLSADEVERRRATYGYNELIKEEPTPLWRLVLEQFDDMLVKVNDFWCTWRLDNCCCLSQT
jgi:magnesium-transporting ATPase (P-type)